MLCLIYFISILAIRSVQYGNWKHYDTKEQIRSAGTTMDEWTSQEGESVPPHRSEFVLNLIIPIVFYTLSAYQVEFGTNTCSSYHKFLAVKYKHETGVRK